MKHTISILFLIVFQNSVFAQYENDCIDYKAYSILKADSVSVCSNRIKVCDLNDIKTAELLFGSNFKKTSYYSKLFAENFTELVYPDGLKLIFPSNASPDFEIKSNKYILLFTNGQQIKVGMKGDELKAIFPKSYSNIKRVTSPGTFNGKCCFAVYFSFTKDKIVIYSDSWIEFILDEDDGVLELFYSYEPG